MEDDFVYDGDDVDYRTITTYQDGEESFSNRMSSAGPTDDEHLIPDLVREYLEYFHGMLQDGGDAYEIYSLYEQSFQKLTEKFYKSSSWPPAEAVAPLVDEDEEFLILYKEMYFRHVYSKLSPTLEQRVESFENYKDLFNLLSSEGFEAELPVQWVHDMLDEFVYQFQSFHQFRAKLKVRTDEEIAFLRKNNEVWDVFTVLQYLESFVDRSNIVQMLERDREAQTKLEAIRSSGQAVDQAVLAEVDAIPDSEWNTLPNMLGYFSIVCLSRVHCLLGDYYLALKVLDPISLTRKPGLFTRVTSCHITLYYYMGFSYMMLRRYSDAIRAFTKIIVFISRTMQYHTRSVQYEYILKKNDQIYSLLAIALSLSPQRIDENVSSYLREKFSEKLQSMQRGEIQYYEELFSYACPKFVNSSDPPYDEEPRQNHNQDAYKYQQELFLSEVRQQALLPTVRSFLKLYTTISVQKLARFLEITEDELRTILYMMKSKSKQLQWNGGPALEGRWVVVGEFDFSLDGDMIHVSDQRSRTSVTQQQRTNCEIFIRHIQKFNEVVDELLKPPSASNEDGQKVRRQRQFNQSGNRPYRRGPKR